MCDKCDACGPSETDVTAAITAWNRLATPDPERVTGRVRWGADSFGKADRALFIGNICAGHILDDYRRTKEGKPAWRAWIMRKDDDGEDLGWFDTVEAARTALESAVREAIGSASDPMTAPDPTGHPFDAIREIADDMEADRRGKAQDRARVLLALADRVVAEEPSRELDADIWDTIGLTPIQEKFARSWCSQNGRTDLTRRLYLLAWSRAFTTSLHAAASAMPAGWRIWMLDQTDTGFAVTLHGPLTIGSLVVSADAPTEPRARTAAALRAMAVEVTNG